MTTRLRQIKWSYLRFAFFDISQTNRARELWLGSKEASGNSLSSRYGNLRSSVFGKPKGQVTFGNFPEGKRQPSAEDFAERPFGSVFTRNIHDSLHVLPSYNLFCPIWMKFGMGANN